MPADQRPGQIIFPRPNTRSRAGPVPLRAQLLMLPDLNRVAVVKGGAEAIELALAISGPVLAPIERTPERLGSAHRLPLLRSSSSDH